MSAPHTRGGLPFQGTRPPGSRPPDTVTQQRPSVSRPPATETTGTPPWAGARLSSGNNTVTPNMRPYHQIIAENYSSNQKTITIKLEKINDPEMRKSLLNPPT